MELRYFGTDGVRGQAGRSPLTLEEVRRWGRAWGQVARRHGVKELVLGWDPRESSLPMAQALLRGLGYTLETCVLGMVPTPAVSWVTAGRPEAWGIMISASHNPPGDNGIKGFDGNGEKLGEEEEFELEEAFSALEGEAEEQAGGAALRERSAPMEAYLRHLGPLDLPAGTRLVVDCAHGATARCARQLLRGGDIHWMGVPDDGARINVGVGSTHMEALREEVLARGAMAGIAFDGDGDRCLLLDPEGGLVDGDQLIWLMTQDLLAEGAPVPGVVGTLMTNGGLEAALAERKVPFVRTPVGDKFMLRELSKRGWDLAAEASGHIIQKRLGPSGDGLATALSVLRALLHREASTRWDWRFRPWPLRLVNVVARDRKPVELCVRLREAQREQEARRGDGIRIVVRWSGTEPKLRLMVEAREAAWMEEALEHLEAAARADLEL